MAPEVGAAMMMEVGRCYVKANDTNGGVRVSLWTLARAPGGDELQGWLASVP